MPKQVRPFGQDRPPLEELDSVKQPASRMPPASLGRSLDDVLKMKEEEQDVGVHSDAAALPHPEPEQAEVVQGIELPTSQIVPASFQPRLGRTDEKQERLKTSIAVAGRVNKPITVRQIAPHKYELLGGSGRFQSVIDLGWPTIPARIIEADDAEAEILAVSDNEGHTDLTDFEKGAAYARILERGKIKSHRALATRLGVSQASVTRCLSFMKLPTDSIQYLERHPALLGSTVVADYVAAGEKDAALVLQALIKIEEEGISQEAALRWLHNQHKAKDLEGKPRGYSISTVTLGAGGSASMTVRKNTISLKLPKGLDMESAQEIIRKAVESIS